MDKEIRIYNLHDPQQYEDEKAYWKSKTPKERLHALEVIRETGNKLIYNKSSSNEDQQRLRRVLRIVEPT
jgi:hypothetical protein